MREDIILLIIGLGLIPAMFWIDKVNANSTLAKEHPEKMKKPWHKRWWIYLIAAVLVVGSIADLANPNTYKAKPGKPKTHRLASDKDMQKEYNKIAKTRKKSEEKKKQEKEAKANSVENSKLRKNVQKEHLTTLKKKLNSLNSDKYGGTTIDSINVTGADHIEVTFTKSFIRENTKDERILVQKSIVDDIGDIYNRYAPYPGNVSLGDIVFFDTAGNGYGIWNTDGEKEGE